MLTTAAVAPIPHVSLFSIFFDGLIPLPSYFLDLVACFSFLVTGSNKLLKGRLMDFGICPDERQ
ncbi:hypothetical protein BDZ91DRAFT_712640 [Kalaharituber pfeilii]|nr:hypothetical protein BDZ91DRAFT_712640 [Kalaharituber pfeilii]